MAQPRSYITDVRSPFEQSLAGIQSALQISSVMQDRKFADERVKLIGAQTSAATAEAKAREAEAAMQASFQKDIGALGPNPPASALSSLMVKYPGYADKLKSAHSALSEEQRSSKIMQASQVYSALTAGKPEVAQQILKEQIDAYKNSGLEQDAKNLQVLSDLINLSPETATASTGMFLAAAMGPDKFTENFSKLETERRARQKEGVELDEAKSKAAKAATEAKFAESNAIMDITKKGWDITKLQEDIAINKENARIAALNLAATRETNVLKKKELELKLTEFKDKREETVRGKVADLESARSTIDNFLNTADRIIATPEGVIKSATGPISAKLPTLSADTADFEELVNTLGSQAFLSQVPSMKGLGALSDAEGKKLSSALQSLSLRQSDKRLMENVKEAQRLILKARETLTKRYGMPETVPDTPAAAEAAKAANPKVIDDLVKKHTKGAR